MTRYEIKFPKGDGLAFMESLMVADLNQSEPLAPGNLAAARETLDGAIANLLEAATAELSEDTQLRKALAEGQQRERRRMQAILLNLLELHHGVSDPGRGILLQLLDEVSNG